MVRQGRQAENRNRAGQNNATLREGQILQKNGITLKQIQELRSFGLVAILCVSC